MILYVTSRNAKYDDGSNPVHLSYLGTSVSEAEEAVLGLSDFQKDEDHFPSDQMRQHYSALPSNVKREMIQFYMCDGWWASIEMIELEASNE